MMDYVEDTSASSYIPPNSGNNMASSRIFMATRPEADGIVEGLQHLYCISSKFS
jgi:hypothetical protein